MPRCQGRRQRGVLIQWSALPRLKLLFLKFLVFKPLLSYFVLLLPQKRFADNSQQSKKTSDVKSLRLDNIYQLVLP